MIFINATESIGKILNAGTLSITGSLMATLLFILIVLIVLCMMFSIPLEFISIIILPFCIAVGSYYSEFLAPIIVIIIYISTLIAKNWLFR